MDFGQGPGLNSGCYKKIPSTLCLRKNRHLFLTIVEAEKFKIKALAYPVSGESWFLIEGSIFLHPYVAEENNRPLKSSFMY